MPSINRIEHLVRCHLALVPVAGRRVTAWHICTDYPAHARKYEVALDESKTTKKGYRDGALVMIDGYLNENTYAVRIGKKRRYSDEQRAKMAERLKNAREKK